MNWFKNKKIKNNITLSLCFSCLFIGTISCSYGSVTKGIVPIHSGLNKLSLTNALETALYHQVNISQARGRIALAETQKLSAISNFIPRLSIDEDPELYKPIGQSGNTIIAGTLVSEEHGFYSNSITANLTANLFSGGKDIAAYRSAMDAIASANEELLESINKVFLAVLSSYVALKKDEITLKKQINILTIDQESAHLIWERYKHGMSSRIDWISAEQAVLQAQAQREKDLQQEALDQKSLLRTIGYMQSFSMIITSGRVPKAPDARFSSLNEMNDPSLESARAQISEARQEVRSARAGFWPTLSLVSQYNWLGINTGNALNAISATKGSNFTIGFALHIPLLPAMNVVASVQSAQVGVVDALGKYDNTMTTFKSRLVYAVEMFRDAEIASETATQADKLAKENLTLTMNRYLAKQGNKIKVNQAQSLAIQASIANQTARLNKTLAKWVLFRSFEPRRFAHCLLLMSGSFQKSDTADSCSIAVMRK